MNVFDRANEDAIELREYLQNILDSMNRTASSENKTDSPERPGRPFSGPSPWAMESILKSGLFGGK